MVEDLGGREHDESLQEEIHSPKENDTSIISTIDDNKTIGDLLARANEGEQLSFYKLFDLLQEVQYGPKGHDVIQKSEISQSYQPES